MRTRTYRETFQPALVYLKNLQKCPEISTCIFKSTFFSQKRRLYQWGGKRVAAPIGVSNALSKSMMADFVGKY